MSLSPGDITVSDGYRSTYVASWAAFTPNSNFMFSVKGSATKIIKILRIGFSGTQTTAGFINITIATAGSIGGVPVSITPTGIVPFDSTSPIATATPLVYTTGFAVTSALLSVKSAAVLVPVPAVINASQNEYIFDFNNDFDQTLILNGTGNFCVMQLSSSPTGFSVCMWVEWTEE